MGNKRQHFQNKIELQKEGSITKDFSFGPSVYYSIINFCSPAQTVGHIKIVFVAQIIHFFQVIFRHTYKNHIPSE